MADSFKGIDLDAGLKRIVPHMPMAQEYGGALQQLQTVWDNLALLGQMAGTGIDISNTRRAFSDLASDLLNQLGTEALRKCLQDASSKAQVAINILVRNLFERTADIGFLACDEDIRAFLRSRDDDAGQGDAASALRARFGEYVRKYSVYSDVVLLEPGGKVVARLDDTESTAVSRDPIVREAIDTQAGYVERFGETDLVSERKKSLVYAFRVVDERGSALGVLCLIFRFENEMELIFSNLVGQDDWAVVTVLDDAGAVIASSDPVHIPIGVTLKPVLDSEYAIVKFGPMEYIATSRAAKPYQGYAGPKWYGHVMVPIYHAFDQDDAQQRPGIAGDVLDAIAHSSDLFSDALRGIPAKAERILRDLNQSLWNGRMSQGAVVKSGTPDFSRILLKEISDTGGRTKDVFGGSIGDLHQTVVTSLLHDNQSQAALAIDIMDRNLYERANDCRWWALASIFAELLSGDQCSEDDGKTVGAVLRAINDLYTVYTNLIVFDRTGRIVAVSNAEKQDIAGSVLDDEWMRRILALRDAQDYVVSDFTPSALYDGRSTYVYGAAIRSPMHQQAVGGVAIVFDAEPQFAAMLKDCLPRDSAGNVRHGAFGVFVEPGGRVIACSDEHFRVGDKIPIDEAMLRLQRGCGRSGIVTIGDSYYAVGANAASGYREYKGPDDAYRNDVIALIFTRLCGVEATRAAAPLAVPSVRSDRTQVGVKEDIATFRVGRRWFAARTREILETIDGSDIAPLPCMPAGMVGVVMYRDAPLPVLDLATIVERAGRTVAAARPPGQIVVMELPNETRFGLLVHDLGEIVEVLAVRLAPLPPMMVSQEAFADTAIAYDGTDDGDLLVVLCAQRLYENLSTRAQAPRAAGLGPGARRTAPPQPVPLAKSA
jgi:chemotaxis signal transduction protein